MPGKPVGSAPKKNEMQDGNSNIDGGEANVAPAAANQVLPSFISSGV